MKIVYTEGVSVGRQKTFPLNKFEVYAVYDTETYKYSHVTSDKIAELFRKDNNYFDNVICDNYTGSSLRVKAGISSKEDFTGSFKVGNVEVVSVPTPDAYFDSITLVRVRGGACFIEPPYYYPVIVNDTWIHFFDPTSEYGCCSKMELQTMGVLSGSVFQSFVKPCKRASLFEGADYNNLYAYYRNKYRSENTFGCNPLAENIKTGELLYDTQEYGYRLDYSDGNIIDAVLLIRRLGLYHDACGYFTTNARMDFTGWDSKTWELCYGTRNEVIEKLGGLKRFYLHKVKNTIGCSEIRDVSYGQVFLSSTEYGTYCKIGELGYDLLQIGGSLFVMYADNQFITAPYVMQDTFIAVATIDVEKDVLMTRCSYSLDKALAFLDNGGTVPQLKSEIESHLTSIKQYVVCRDWEE